MKKIITVLVSAAAFVLVSCSDFLNQPVRGKENLDTYFESEEEAERFLTGCYGAICYNDWWQVGKFWNMTDMSTDDCWMGNTTQDQSDYYSIVHYQGVGQSNESVANFWQYRYKGILRCNVAIERIPTTDMLDTDKKERMIAEAKFLRAFLYLDLVKNFGGVPLVKGFLMPEEVQGIVRSDVTTVFGFVEADLVAAAAVLPQRDEYGSTDVGRATRGAALGLLGKVYLYQEKWTETRDVLKTVIDEGRYDLMTDFGDVWSVDHNNSKESLFEVQYAYDETYSTGGFFSILCGSREDPGDGWAWGLPSSNLEQAFVTAGDSERLKWTIIKHGATQIAGVDAASFRANVGDSFSIDPSKHKSGRINRKFFIPFDKRPDPYAMKKLPLNHRLLRYADVLLMYAEAKNMLGEDVGELSAQWALNKVRDRVDLTAVNQTGTALRDAIRTERRLELALEQNRLYDIRRWTDDNGKKTVCNLMGPSGTFVAYNERATDKFERENSGEPSNKGATFIENRDLLFPIPLYEITMSHGSIEQNPNWN